MYFSLKGVQVASSFDSAIKKQKAECIQKRIENSYYKTEIYIYIYLNKGCGKLRLVTMVLYC